MGSLLFGQAVVSYAGKLQPGNLFINLSFFLDNPFKESSLRLSTILNKKKDLSEDFKYIFPNALPTLI